MQLSGSVPADLGKALLEQARADCGPVPSGVSRCASRWRHLAGYHLNGGTPIDPQRRIVEPMFRARPCLPRGQLCDVMSVMLLSVLCGVGAQRFTLLRDDVMDGDTTRKWPTVWSVWGVGGAILLGDALRHNRSDTDRPDRRSVAVRAIRAIADVVPRLVYRPA